MGGGESVGGTMIESRPAKNERHEMLRRIIML